MKAVGAVAAVVSLAAVGYATHAGASSGGGHCATYNPKIPPPGQFSKTIDNPYFPLPVGRTLLYRGVENGNEDTKELLPGGKVDRSGSWLTGKDGGKPGLIMEADPRVPDAYRQECLSGEAEDLAWVVGRSGSKHLLRTLEFSPLEPAIVDRKVYGRGVGIISERQLSGGHETLSLVRVTG